jgi:hypothetical protein
VVVNGESTTRIELVSDQEILEVSYYRIIDGQKVLIAENLPKYRNDEEAEIGNSLVDSYRSRVKSESIQEWNRAKHIKEFKVDEKIKTGESSSKKVFGKPVPTQINEKISFSKNIKFIDKRTEPISRSKTINVMKELANILNENKDLQLTIYGNVGWGHTISGRPIGSSAFSYPVEVDGKQGTTFDLMIGRARAIRDILIKEMNVDPKQIRASVGNVYQGEERRVVSFELKKINE